METYDTCIIGAGLTGLYLTRELTTLFPQKKICLFEASENLGGRVLSIEVGDSHFDLGATRYSQDNHPLLSKLILSLGLRPHAFHFRTRHHQLFSESRKLMQELDDQFLKGEIPKNQNFKKVVSERFGRDVLANIRRSFGYSILEREDLILDEALRITKQHPEGEEVSTSTKWNTLDSGLRSLIKSIADKLDESFIKRGHKVHTVSQIKEGWKIEFDDQVAIKARKIIFSVPPYVLKKINFPKTQKIEDILNNISEVSLFKTVLNFEHNWWREYGYQEGDCVVGEGHARKIFLYKKNTMMLYCDDKSSEYLNENRNNWNLLGEEIKKTLNIPSSALTTKPSKIVSKFWKHGVYIWKRGVLPNDLEESLFLCQQGLYICTGDLSINSGWLESGLEMSEKVINLLKEKEKN